MQGTRGESVGCESSGFCGVVIPPYRAMVLGMYILAQNHANPLSSTHSFTLKAFPSLRAAVSFCKLLPANNQIYFFLPDHIPTSVNYLLLNNLCHLFHASVGALKIAQRERLPDLRSHVTGNYVDKQYKITFVWKQPFVKHTNRRRPSYYKQ